MPNPLVSQLVRAMDNTQIHMDSLKSPFGLMRFKVTEFQHLYLELYALLDYPEINKPCMDRHQPPATTITNCIGAFTNIPHITQYFHRAGLPIWFLQPWKTGPFPYNVLSVVLPLNPTDSLCISPHDPPSPMIFHGYMNTQERHNAIQSYSQKWLVFKDPFYNEPPSKYSEAKRHVHVAPGASCEPIPCLS